MICSRGAFDREKFKARVDYFLKKIGAASCRLRGSRTPTAATSPSRRATFQGPFGTLSSAGGFFIKTWSSARSRSRRAFAIRRPSSARHPLRVAHRLERGYLVASARAACRAGVSGKMVSLERSPATLTAARRDRRPASGQRREEAARSGSAPTASRSPPISIATPGRHPGRVNR